MYLLAKSGDLRSNRKGDTNSYINSYMDILEKAELIASTTLLRPHFKSGITIYNSKVPDTASRKTRRTKAIATRFAFQPNTKN